MAEGPQGTTIAVQKKNTALLGLFVDFCIYLVSQCPEQELYN